jgi:short-subunit dehydrogenase
MKFIERYGPTAVILGASEGIGAAFAKYLAAQKLNLVLVARSAEKLEVLRTALLEHHKIAITIISQDLGDPDAIAILHKKLHDLDIGMVVYNAAYSLIGPFEENSLTDHQKIAQVNMLSPLAAMHLFGKDMLIRSKGGFIQMASLAGFQGSGYLSVYAGSKAFDRVIAESLWYEWREKGVDVIACCAGATATPNFINTKPEKASLFAPKVQLPEEVVKECMRALGKKPSIITGRGNRIASFFMQHILPRKLAIKIMGDNTRKMYRL